MTQLYDCSGFDEAGFKFVAANDSIIETTDLTTANWVDLSSGTDKFATHQSMYALPAAVDADVAYRYVGIVGNQGKGMPLREMTVCADAVSYDFGTYTAFASGNDGVHK